MGNTMSPSMKPLTDGQMIKLTDQIRDKLRKSNLPSAESQIVIEQQGEAIALQVVDDIRKRIEALSGMIVRPVKVDRTRSPKDILDATGRTQYTDKGVVKAMPKGEGDEVEVCFFKIGRAISDDNLESEYALRGLIPADPYSLAQVNADYPAFADERPNGTHWKDTDGKWCFAAFDRWGGERSVYVDRSDVSWDDDWWFAGLRK